MNRPSHPATSPLLYFRENNCCDVLFWCLWKSSEHFLSHSLLCSRSHSQTHSELCLCHYIQQGAIPVCFWQSLANVQLATFWELVMRLPPDTSDPYSLLGCQLGPFRSAAGVITVEDHKIISCNFCTGMCCCT